MGPCQPWASSSGRKMRTFFAHWCRRTAFSQLLSGGLPIAEDVRGNDVGGAQAVHQPRQGVRDHGSHAGGEDRKVGPGVADVGEIVAEAVAEGVELVLSCEIVPTVGGKDVFEDPEMGGDPVGERTVSGCRQVECATFGVAFVQESEQRPVVGQVDDVDRHGGGDVAFERGFSLQKPRGY